MKKTRKDPRWTKIGLSLFLAVLLMATTQAQPTLFIRTGDFNGDGITDELWSGGTSSTPYLYVKRGGTGVWNGYFVGPTYSVANTGLDLNGVAGLEITYWHPSSQSMVIITDRTKTTKGYFLGSTGLNSWVQCFNSFTNIDGVAGAEIKVNYYTRCSACLKGYMIVHRTQTTKSTLTCASLTREATPGEEVETPEPTNVNDREAVTYPKGYFDKEVAAHPPVKEKAILTVAPNPAQNTIALQTETADEVMTKVVISDAAGNPVFTATQPAKTIDISNLKAGMYLVTAETDRKIYTAKFIKQ